MRLLGRLVILGVLLVASSAYAAERPGVVVVHADDMGDGDQGIAPTMADVSYGPHKSQVLNLWKADSSKPTPVLFKIHGGAWKSGAKDEVLVNDDWLKQGVSVVSIDYRLSDEAILPAPVMDAARALQFVRYKAKEWNLDKERIALTGGSAGGCTSLWLAFHDDLADPRSPDPVLRESTKPICALTLNGQSSIVQSWILQHVGTPADRHGMIWKSVGAESPKDLMSRPEAFESLARRFSPILHLDKDDPPVAVVTNFKLDNRGIHSPWFGIALKKEALGKGADVKLFCKEKHDLSEDYGESTEYLKKYLLD